MANPRMAMSNAPSCFDTVGCHATMRSKSAAPSTSCSASYKIPVVPLGRGWIWSQTDQTQSVTRERCILWRLSVILRSRPANFMAWCFNPKRSIGFRVRSSGAAFPKRFSGINLVGMPWPKENHMIRCRRVHYQPSWTGVASRKISAILDIESKSILLGKTAL